MKSQNMLRKALIALIILAVTVGAVVGGSAVLEKIQNNRKAQTQETEIAHSMKWTDDNTLYLMDEAWGFDHRIETYLFIGTDASGNEEASGKDYRGAMADFLLLLVMDHTDDTYGFIQLDRNTITEIKRIDSSGEQYDDYEEQLCTAHWYGSNKEESAVNTVDAVKNLLGEIENITGYYVLNMKDVPTLNHVIGGVEIEIDEDLTSIDPAFVEGTTIILNDAQAEQYVRARMSVGEGDNVSRMRRQRIYINSFFKKAKSKAKTDPQFADDLWDALEDVSVSDMNGNVFSRIAEMVRSGESKGILTLDGETKLGTVLGDGVEHEEFYPSEESILDVMKQLFSLELIEEDEEEE